MDAPRMLRAQAASERAEATARMAAADARATALETIADHLERAHSTIAGDPDQLVTHHEAGVSAAKWNEAAKDGTLPARKVGKYYKAKRSDVAEWIATLPNAKAASQEAAEKAPSKPELLDRFERARQNARARQSAKREAAA